MVLIQILMMTENQRLYCCAVPCKATPDIIIADSKHKCHEIGCGIRICGLCMTEARQSNQALLYYKKLQDTLNMVIVQFDMFPR